MNQVKVEPAIKSLFEELEGHEHEQIIYCYDKPTGLKAIIGLHNTVLGPGIGGTRMWLYKSEAEALTDVLRLSKAMTYKASISGLNAGGGKAVIIADAQADKSEALLRRFGQFIHSLGGRYVTAEDVNMSTRDMELISKETPYVTGLPEEKGGSGDPSPVTAYGVYLGIKAASKKQLGTDNLAEKKIAVQGVGQVGKYLVEYLVKEGAKIYISDISNGRLEWAAQRFPVEIVNHEEIYDLDVDVYAPCALGATINCQTIPRFNCSIIAGGANNQLQDEEIHGQMLKDKGILFAPDFLINAGGLMNVYAEFQGNYDREAVYKMTEGIYQKVFDVFNVAEKENLHPQKAARVIAVKRIKENQKIN